SYSFYAKSCSSMYLIECPNAMVVTPATLAPTTEPAHGTNLKICLNTVLPAFPTTVAIINSFALAFDIDRLYRLDRLRIKLTCIRTKGTKSDPGTGNAPTFVAVAPAETIQLFAILLLSFSSFPKSKSLDFSSKIASIASCKSVKFSPVLEDIGITGYREFVCSFT